MNGRERFLAVIHFREPDYIPLLRCWSLDGPHLETVRTWQKEQGFKWIKPESKYGTVCRRWDEIWGMMWVRNWGPGSEVGPRSKPKILKRDETYETIRHADGSVVRRRIGDFVGIEFYSMPQFIEFPCKNRDDWESYRDRWVPMEDGVYPDNWEELVSRWRDRDYPLGTVMPGSFSVLRDLFGTKRACTLFYEDPDLVREILSHYRERAIRMLGRLVADVQLDFVSAFEDFCYRHGCFVSPRIFREFILPHYRKETKFARDHGIDLFYVDSDGFVEDIIELLEEANVNGLSPFEVRAGNDILRIREAHPNFIIWGGLDKLVMDEKDVSFAEREIDRKVPPLLELGGYFPSIDHALPPTSQWRTYLHFMNKLHKLCRNPEGKFREYI